MLDTALSTNNSNLKFYRNIDLDYFKKLAENGGFNLYTDLELIYDEIVQADSILELGAGYGRCLEFLVQKQYKGKIFAVEQSPKLVKYLRQVYADKVEIIHGDIKSMKIPQKVDLALWMWSGLSDFSKEEQKICFQRIADCLNDNGKVVIDVPRVGVKTFGIHQDDQNLIVVTPYGKMKCYIPNEEDVKETAGSAGFKLLRSIDYKTMKEKERTMFIIQK
ncbi:MAG TPA: class I SAM-dependent methyltransferase [Cytophagaceae bacterium]